MTDGLSQPRTPEFASDHNAFRWSLATVSATEDDLSLTSVRVSKYSTHYDDSQVSESSNEITSSNPYSASSPVAEYTSQYAHPASPSTRHVSASPSIEEEAEGDIPHPRIPRPPNAFMLFRSSCIQKIRAQVKERGGEKRQQVFSRVAGEAWHLLQPEERIEWQRKAQAALQAHQLKYPDYKFMPSPRGSARKGKGRSVDDRESVQDIRTKYLNIPGEVVKSPVTRKRSRKAHSPNDAISPPSYASPSLSYVSPTSSQASSPKMAYATFSYPPVPHNSYPVHVAEQQYSNYMSPHASLPSNAYPSFGSAMYPSHDVFAPHQHDSNLPSHFPNPSWPHYLGETDQRMAPPHIRNVLEQPAAMASHHITAQRRPSTSLGFADHKTPSTASLLPSQDPIPRPASASCNMRPSSTIVQPLPAYAMHSSTEMQNMLTYTNDNDFASCNQLSAQSATSTYFDNPNPFPRATDLNVYQQSLMYNYEQMANSFTPEDYSYAQMAPP